MLFVFKSLARVVKLVDTTDLKSVATVKRAYRFDSGSGHQHHKIRGFQAAEPVQHEVPNRLCDDFSLFLTCAVNPVIYWSAPVRTLGLFFGARRFSRTQPDGRWLKTNQICAYGPAIFGCSIIIDIFGQIKKPRIAARLYLFGSPTWIRTRDLRINSPSLYRLSYQGIKRCAS